MNPSSPNMSPHDSPWSFVSALAGIGALIAVGRVLADDMPVTPRVMLGRAILSAGTGVAAGSVLMFFPEAPALLLYGVGAALSSLGTSGIEMLLARRFGSGPNTQIGVSIPPQAPGQGRPRFDGRDE